ncbi:MAG: hypothetical protein WC505_07575 [Patescibacteria group bacterium]
MTETAAPYNTSDHVYLAPQHARCPWCGGEPRMDSWFSDNNAAICFQPCCSICGAESSSVYKLAVRCSDDEDFDIRLVETQIPDEAWLGWDEAWWTRHTPRRDPMSPPFE